MIIYTTCCTVSSVIYVFVLYNTPVVIGAIGIVTKGQKMLGSNTREGFKRLYKNSCAANIVVNYCLEAVAVRFTNGLRRKVPGKSHVIREDNNDNI
jgi:hypothetical protein